MAPPNTHAEAGPDPSIAFDPHRITRPAPVLMHYYVVAALLTGPGLFVMLPLLWFRYLTLQYRFDDEGIWIGSGLLFKREVNLTYRRIQDIHLTRGLLQRWFGLATVSVQTASGSATPEMRIEGVLEAEELRDFLYARMRGARGEPVPSTPTAGSIAGAPTPPSVSLEALAVLRDIRDTLRAQRGDSGSPQGAPR